MPDRVYVVIRITAHRNGDAYVAGVYTTLRVARIAADRIREEVQPGDRVTIETHTVKTWFK